MASPRPYGSTKEEATEDFVEVSGEMWTGETTDEGGSMNGEECVQKAQKQRRKSTAHVRQVLS